VYKLHCQQTPLTAYRSRSWDNFEGSFRTVAQRVRNTSSGGTVTVLFNTNQGSVFMLVLTRKYQEKIRIGDNITITVLRTKGKAVRLGIEAPSDVPVIRGELSFEISEDEAEAAVDSTPAEPTMAKRAVRRPNPSWSAESPAQSSQVQLKRVPRGEVSEYLPKLVTGSAPLRAMMEQR
jgi:carbon storage regulator